jgi:hypothetical protein
MIRERQRETELCDSDILSNTFIVALSPGEKGARHSTQDISLATTALETTLFVRLDDLVAIRDEVDLALLQDGHVPECLGQCTDDSLWVSPLIHALLPGFQQHINRFGIKAKRPYEFLAEPLELDHIWGQDGARVTLYDLRLVLDEPETVCVDHNVHALLTGLTDRFACCALHVVLPSQSWPDHEGVEAGEEPLEFGFDLVSGAVGKNAETHQTKLE